MVQNGVSGLHTAYVAWVVCALATLGSFAVTVPQHLPRLVSQKSQLSWALPGWPALFMERKVHHLKRYSPALLLPRRKLLLVAGEYSSRSSLSAASCRDFGFSRGVKVVSGLVRSCWVA